MTDYAQIAAEVADGLGVAGVSVTILETTAATGSDFDPTPGAVIEHQAKAVLSSFADYEYRRDTIEAGDRKLLVEAHDLTHTPRTADRVRIGTIVYRVVSVEAIAPANIPVLWKLQVRAA